MQTQTLPDKLIREIKDEFFEEKKMGVFREITFDIGNFEYI